jgi:cytochrome c556
MGDEKKLPIPQFAAKIKQKYPQYKDMDDTELVNKIIAKYPEYESHVDISAKKKDLAQPIPTSLPKPAKAPENEYVIGLGTSLPPKKESFPSELPSNSVLQIARAMSSLKANKASRRDEATQYIEKNNRLRAQLEAAGYNPDEVERDFGTLPEDSGINMGEALRLKKENPTKFKRYISAATWQPTLLKAIQKSGDTGLMNRIIEEREAKGSRTNVRASMRTAIDAANTYIEDADEREKVVKAIISDKKYGYGQVSEEDESEFANDPKSMGLNPYQANALQFLEDTDPSLFKTYSKLISVTPQLNDDAALGSEIKLRELEEIGMQIEMQSLTEAMGDAESEDEYNKLQSRYETIQKDIELQPQRYPKATAVDADMLMQEALGQKNSAVMRGVLNVGKGVDNAVNWLGDIFQSPFQSGEESAIADLEELGRSRMVQSVMLHTTAENQLFNPQMVIKMNDDVKAQVDAVKGSDLSEQDKQDKVREIMRKNIGSGVGMVPNDKAGRFNPTASAWANTVSDVGSQILTQVGLALTTGGAGNISKAGQITRMFGTVYATSYNDRYAEAIEKNVKNPTTYATVHTAIEAASELINNDLAMLKKIFPSTSTMGKIIKNISKEEFEQIVKSKAYLLRQFRRQVKQQYLILLAR